MKTYIGFYLVVLVILTAHASEDIDFWWHSYGPGACRTDAECLIQYGPESDEEIQGVDGPCDELRPDHPDYCEVDNATN